MLDFIPFNISDNVKEAFAENAKKLGVANPFRSAFPSIRSLYRMMSRFSLDMGEWPDLTNMFNLNPAPSEAQNLQQTPSGAASINPQIYNRPALTLNPITGLTAAQTALLSPADQQYYIRKNQTRVT